MLDVVHRERHRLRKELDRRPGNVVAAQVIGHDVDRVGRRPPRRIADGVDLDVRDVRLLWK
jgi:hypothetical protein